MNKVSVIVAVTFLASVSALAQAPPPPVEAGPNVMFFQSASTGPAGGVMAGAAGMFTMALPGSDKVIMGAPYTATVSTEMIQTLSDGNRITNKTEATMYRDSRGRTRREETMGMAGPWQVNGPKLVFINDPDSQTNLVIDPAKQTATVMKLPGLPGLPGLPPPGVSAGITVDYLQTRPGGIAPEETKTESLGIQVLEGVSAEGKRVTRTIPAGQIGNTLPIEITSEVWFSPDLQIVVMSKHHDPRFGETIYQLSRIERLEPDHSLFEVPAGYTVKNSSFGSVTAQPVGGPPR